MIRFSDDAKSIKIPRNLGPNQSSVEGGISREECIQIVDNAIEEYDDDVIDPLKETVEGKSTVEWEQLVTGGTKIAVVTIDGTPTDVYAPTSGGGGVTPEQVQQQIDESLVDYPTSAVTQDLDERVTELENASVDYATTADTQALETAISGKSTVDWNQIVTGGTKVAEITIDGTKTDVYAPTSGGGGVTPQDVQDAIDSALTPYETAQQADAKYAEKPLTAVIYHDGTEDNPFTQADIAQLQAMADALSGLTSGDTVPYAYIDLMDDTGLRYRFVLTYGDSTSWAFIAPDTDGCTSCFTLNTADVSESSYYAGAGWDDAIANYVESEVQPQIDALTAQTASLATEQDRAGRAIGDLQTGKQDKLTPGTGIQISGNTISCTVSGYTLPIASQQVLGGVKVGSGLTIDQNGVLSVSGGTSSDGYVWTTDAEYDAMTQAEKEAWYDNIYSGASAGNYKFGIIVTTEPWNPEEHQDLDVKCRSLRLSWVEDGYDSLHFNDANYSDNNFRGMEYRIARGGTWDRIDEKNLDITKFTESSEDRRVFKITTGLTAYGGFDGYMFNRAFSEPQQPWEYYSAVGSMPLLIVSPHQDNPDEYDLVCTANILACGEAPNNLYIDGWAKRFVFRYFLNGELYEAIMDSVSGGSGDGLHLIHNYSVYGNWVGSQADYNAIGAGNYDSKVIYHIDR